MPKPVGSLPLNHFIYYIIAALVILLSSFSIWAIFRALLSPRKYLLAHLSAREKDPPPYRARRPPAPSSVASFVREEVRRHRSLAKYQYQVNSHRDAWIMEKPNLPLLVDGEVIAPGNGADTFLDVPAWENEVKEKARLKTTIANLQRIAQARKDAGEQVAINPRLLAALQRRAKVENSINAAYERFRERRAEWTEEEWRVVEQIMECSHG